MNLQLLITALYARIDNFLSAVYLLDTRLYKHQNREQLLNHKLDMEQKILLPKSYKVLKAITWLALVLALSFFTRQLSAQDLCKPIGWATQNGGVTGGGNATAVVVSNYAALKDAVTDKNVKVIHVQGVITFPSNGRINIQDQSGKTIFGLPGSKLISTDMSSGGSGIFYVKRIDNLIIRNMYFEGPGAYDNDGNDNLTVDDSRNVWVDHCEFHDGMDGNFDIKNKADFISVTWCTFSYEKPPKSGGSGGSSDHRYTNLIGSSDGATADEGKLRVTFQYCWWGEGCKERMPRVRYGKVDLVNNYYSSSVANQGVRAGYKADIRVEGNYFISGYSKPIDEFDKDYTAIYANNNTGANNMTKGSAFTRPYSIAIASASSIVTPIRTCAGAKLASPTACSSCGGGVVTPTNNPPSVFITSPADNQQFNTSPATITITANANDSDGSVTKVEFYQGATKLGEDNTNPYAYTWSGVTSGSYTLTAKATDDKGATTTSSTVSIIVGTIVIGGDATLTKHGSGSSTQTMIFGTAIESFYYDWTNATTVTVTGMPAGIQTAINNEAKTVTFSGTAIVSGIFDYTITTVGSTNNTSKSGTITITGGVIYDCNNVANGTAYIDNCNQCVGGNTGATACIKDCAGEWGGTLMVDDCGVCGGLNACVDCNGDMNGSAYLDNCGVCVGGNSSFQTCVGEVEGETACSVDGIQLENTNAGFFGQGYVNTENILGAQASWVLNSTTAQQATISFRYANGGDNPRSGDITINGNSVGEATFNTTGDWTNWSMFSANIDLVAGSNELIITATGVQGLANIDIIYFSEGVSNTSCLITSINGHLAPATTAYPNPTLNRVRLSKSIDWQVFNSSGVIIMEGKSNSVDLSNSPAGIYFLKSNEQLMKIVKE